MKRPNGGWKLELLGALWGWSVGCVWRKARNDGG